MCLPQNLAVCLKIKLTINNPELIFWSVMKTRTKFGISIVAACVAAVCFTLQSCTAKKSNESASNAAEQNSPTTSQPIYTESSPQNSATAGISGEDITKSRQNSLTRAVAVCSPAIVGINVTEVYQYQVRDPFDEFMNNDPMFQQFFGRHLQRSPQTYSQEVKSLGSGFLISADGYILTNDHVAGNAKKVVVTMTNGEKYDAKIIGSDKVSDVALLKIEGKNFPFLRLANSDEVIVGEWAIAFGNPFGLFDINAKPTVTVGVVSNTGVNLFQEGRVYRGMVQTDAAISSGNSGGPLVNSLGEVMAMNTIIYSTAQNSRGSGSIGIGFAIPMNRVKKIVNVLRDEGKIDREFSTGLSVRSIDENLAKSLKIDKSQGVVISEIMRGSAADKAGLEPGDVILEIDGTKIVHEDDVLVMVNDGVVGQRMTLTILRDGDRIKKTISLDRRRK